MHSTAVCHIAGRLFKNALIPIATKTPAFAVLNARPLPTAAKKSALAVEAFKVNKKYHLTRPRTVEFHVLPQQEPRLRRRSGIVMPTISPKFSSPYICPYHFVDGRDRHLLDCLLSILFSTLFIKR